jgi:hypothetical protein
MEPADFKAMVGWLREAAAMRDGTVDKSDTTPYRDMKRIFEQSCPACLVR